MKRLCAAFCLLLFVALQSFADEGMWLYTMLDTLKLDTKGCRLTAQQIYNINHSSIKDAIVGLGFGDNPAFFFCSAELVSSQGLVLTNHHCGFEMIQKHSNLTSNYLQDGYWAKTLQDELVNQDVTASILMKMSDVTDSILPLMKKQISYEKQCSSRDSIISVLEKRETKEGITAKVSSMFEGNAYYLFVYKTYRDVRLVGAPPESIGKFGGDTDNWMWPRHTGDFSVLRIYTDKNGNPAPFDKDNIPLKTDHALSISLKGYKKNDFAMIMGFPGATNRFITSFGLENKIVSNSNRVEIRTEKLGLIKSFMQTNPEIKLKYAAKYAESSNYWKNFMGENEAYAKLDIVNHRKKEEAKFNDWIQTDSARYKVNKNIFTDIKAYSDAKAQWQSAYDYSIESLFYGPEIIDFAWHFFNLKRTIDNAENDQSKIRIAREAMASRIEDYFANYDITVDKALFVKMVTLFIQKVKPEYYPLFIKEIAEKYKGNVAKYADKLYKKSLFVSRQKTLNVFKNLSFRRIEHDKIYLAMQSIRQVLQTMSTANKTVTDNYIQAMSLYGKAVSEMYRDSLFYPDANGTPRFTFGYVGGYNLKDAVSCNYFTTLKGVMEKEDSTNDEFIVPPKLKQLFKDKDYGNYAENDTMRVCFLTNNDITGGNSGSAVLNADGQLIGLAFDGNWEALSGDVEFEKRLQRTINVDIRYVLFIIDKYAGAKNLINELNFAK